MCAVCGRRWRMWVDGCGWMEVDGWMDGWMGGWIDGVDAWVDWSRRVEVGGPWMDRIGWAVGVC